MEDMSINPSILFFFGILLFTIGFAYTITAISKSREKGRITGHPLRDIFIYSFFYLLMYPPLLIVAFYKYMRGYSEW